METLPTVIAPPAPAKAAAPAPALTPVPTLAPTPALTPVAEVTPAAPAKPAKRESFEEAISRRVTEAQKGLKAEKATEEKVAADKAAAEAKAAADKVAAEKVVSTPDPVDATDDQFKQQVETETKGMDPKSSKAWAELRYSERALKRAAKDLVPSAKLTELQSQLTEAQKQIEAAKSVTPADPQEIANLKAELDALKKNDAERENELTVAKVEATKEFKQAVTQPLAKVAETVKALAKKYEVGERDLLDAISDTSDAQSDRLTELTEKMNRFDLSKVDGLVKDVLAANEKATVLRANAAEALAKVSVKTEAQVAAQNKAASEARQAAHTTNWQKMKAELPDLLTPVAGEDDVSKNWNQAQTAAEKFARDTDFAALKPEVQSEVQARAAVFPLLMGKLQALEAQVKDSITAHEAALERLAKFEKATPPGAAERSGEADKSTPRKGNDFVKNTEAAFKAAGF